MVDNQEEQNNHWFIPKRYGYGLEPVTWQGWLMTLVFIAIVMGAAVVDFPVKDEPTPRQVGRFLIDLFLLTSLFLIISLPKTKGTMRWRWGQRDEDAL